MELFIILFLVLLNGLFSMSEIAVISARKTKLKHEAAAGDSAAKAAYKLQSNPDTFLSTIQIGITLIGILTGLYSGDVLAAKLTPYLIEWGLTSAFAMTMARLLIVVLVTYISILFGELVPKRIGLSSAEKVAKTMARPMTILSLIAKPFVWLLSKSTSLLFGLLGIPENNNKITEEEIKAMIKEGTIEGEVQEVEQDIMERVFTLGDRDIESIMTPRNEVIYLDAGMSKEEIRRIISRNSISRFPVLNEKKDSIEGVVTLKDIFTKIEDDSFSLANILQPAQYFYESIEVYQALDQMKRNHNYFGMVINEFGSLIGVVSMKDIMEAMVGEMPDENEEPEIMKQKDGSFLVDGQCSFYSFLHYFKKTNLYRQQDYNTIGGLLLEEFGYLPTQGEHIVWEVFSLKVETLEGARIDKIRVRVIN